MSQNHLDTLAFSHEMYDHASRAMAFQASTSVEAERWQRNLKAKLVELLGDFPSEEVRIASPSHGNAGVLDLYS